MKKNNKDKSEKSKITFSGILGNNRILMLVSVIIAFGLWLWVSVEKSPETQTIITDVPVQINLENSIPQQLGLEIFGESNYTVDVTVTGKKYVLSALTKDDIIVSANVNYVDSPGIKTLQLRINPADDNDNFTIASSSSTYIEVFFDTPKEIEMALEGKINTTLKTIVPEECLLGDIVFSKGTVKVKGPATEINRINKVRAEVNVDSVLTKTTTFDPQITMLTSDGTKLEYCVTDMGDMPITMTVPVLKVVTLPTAIEFRNAPADFVANPLSYTVSPASVNVAVPVEVVDTTKVFVVDTIDFADIVNSYNTFNVEASSINSFKITDKYVTRFRVRIDASAYSAKSVTISPSSVTIKNNRADFDVKVDTERDITVNLAGPEAELNAITPQNITIEIDTADMTISPDTKSLQGRVIISNANGCWAVGKYDIKVAVTPLS